MKLNKNMEFYCDYLGTSYEVYVDKTHDPKYALVDMKNHEIIKWAQKVEKFDKIVYGG